MRDICAKSTLMVHSGGTQKFYEVFLFWKKMELGATKPDGRFVLVKRYGAIKSSGKEKVEVYESSEEATTEYDRIIRTKQKGNSTGKYQPVPGSIDAYFGESRKGTLTMTGQNFTERVARAFNDADVRAEIVRTLEVDADIDLIDRGLSDVAEVASEKIVEMNRGENWGAW